MAHIKFRCVASGYGTVSTLLDVVTKQNGNDTDPRQQEGPSPYLSKRPADKDDYPMEVKRLFEDKMKEINNNISAKTKGDSSDKVILDSSNNDTHETWSAFKKVEKNKISDLGCKTDTAPTSQFPVQNQSIRLKYEMELNKYLCNRFVPPNATNKGTSQSMGMFLSSNWMMPNLVSDQHNVTRDSRQDKLLQPSVEKPRVTDIRGLSKTVFDARAMQTQNNDLLQKQLILDELQSFQLSHFKPSNPMVDKLIHTATSPTLLQRPMRTLGVAAQNWCAKCNASFRMTSDLVYHMRSHHKREFDPMKRKREEKLQCNVCRETFKERHHLTRHMTSHT